MLGIVLPASIVVLLSMEGYPWLGVIACVLYAGVVHWFMKGDMDWSTQVASLNNTISRLQQEVHTESRKRRDVITDYFVRKTHIEERLKFLAKTGVPLVSAEILNLAHHIGTQPSMHPLRVSLPRGSEYISLDVELGGMVVYQRWTYNDDESRWVMQIGDERDARGNAIASVSKGQR